MNLLFTFCDYKTAFHSIDLHIIEYCAVKERSIRKDGLCLCKTHKSRKKKEKKLTKRTTVSSGISGPLKQRLYFLVDDGCCLPAEAW